jgi:hypothetical protein
MIKTSFDVGAVENKAPVTTFLVPSLHRQPVILQTTRALRQISLAN